MESVVILLSKRVWSSENDFLGEVIGGWSVDERLIDDLSSFWDSDLMGIEVLDNDWGGKLIDIGGDIDSLKLLIGSMVLIKGAVSISVFLKVCEWDNEDWCVWIELNVSNQKINHFVKQK